MNFPNGFSPGYSESVKIIPVAKWTRFMEICINIWWQLQRVFTYLVWGCASHMFVFCDMACELTYINANIEHVVVANLLQVRVITSHFLQYSSSPPPVPGGFYVSVSALSPPVFERLREAAILGEASLLFPLSACLACLAKWLSVCIARRFKSAPLLRTVQLWRCFLATEGGPQF